MVSISQIEQGLADYIDAELMPKLPRNSIYKLIVGTSAAIAVKRVGGMIDELKTNPIMKGLGLVDENDNVDIDIILDELKCQMPEEGYRFEAGRFGKFDMIIKGDDIEELHRYIVRR